MGKSIYQRKLFKLKVELINSIDPVYCGCGCFELVFPNFYNYQKIINDEPVYIIGHNARVYTYFNDKEFLIRPKDWIVKGTIKKKKVTDNQYHNRQYQKSEKKCVLSGMTEDKHKKIYGCRPHMHCRDGNYSNQETSNWECVSQGLHSILDKLDFRKINQHTTGVKGHV